MLNPGSEASLRYRNAYNSHDSPNKISCTPSSSSSEARSSTVHKSRSTSLQEEGCVTDEILSRRADAVLTQICRPRCRKYKLSETLFETPFLEKGACLKKDVALALRQTLATELLHVTCMRTCEAEQFCVQLGCASLHQVSPVGKRTAKVVKVGGILERQPYERNKRAAAATDTVLCYHSLLRTAGASRTQKLIQVLPMELLPSSDYQI